MKQQQAKPGALACRSRQPSMPNGKPHTARPELPSQRYRISTWLVGGPQQVSVEQVHATGQRSKCLKSCGYRYQLCHFSGPPFVSENTMYVTGIPNPQLFSLTLVRTKPFCESILRRMTPPSPLSQVFAVCSIGDLDLSSEAVSAYN